MAGHTTCDQCERSFKRRTSERVCSDCLAPLRRLREAAGLTLAELAGRVDCRPTTIWELEREKYNPALMLAERLASEFGVDVGEAFPRLKVTKQEAQQLLRMTSRDVKRLCDDGELPCDADGHWHRLDYAAVRALAGEREALRRDLISFHAAEREFGLPWWLLAQLQGEGRLDVRIGDHRKRLVHREQLEAVRAELVAERKSVHCPLCGRWPKLGRRAHRDCLGPLASRGYWLDRETRGQRREEHGELMRRVLRARSVNEVAKWYRSRFNKEPTKSLFGRWSFRKGGGRPRRAYSDEQAEEVRALKRRNPTYGYVTLADRTGLNIMAVRRILAAERRS